MSKTAIHLMPQEPFIIYRAVPSAVLKYQTDKTSSTKPEGIIINSQTPPIGVAIRDEPQSTGGAVYVTE